MLGSELNYYRYYVDKLLYTIVAIWLFFCASLRLASINNALLRCITILPAFQPFLYTHVGQCILCDVQEGFLGGEAYWFNWDQIKLHKELTL